MTGTHDNAKSRWDNLVRLNAAAAAPSADFESFRAFCEKHGVGPDDIPNDIFKEFGLGRIRGGDKPKRVQKALREIRAELRRLKNGTGLIPPSRPQQVRAMGARQQQFAALPEQLQQELGGLKIALYDDVSSAAFAARKRFLLIMMEVLEKANFKVSSLEQLFSREAFKVLREHQFGKHSTILIDDAHYQFTLVARRYHIVKGNTEMAERFTRLGNGAGKLKRTVAPSTLMRVGQLNPKIWREMQKTCILALEAAASEPESRDKQLKARDALFGTLVCVSARSCNDVREARFANPLAEGTADGNDAALLIDGTAMQLSDRHNRAISAWRWSKASFAQRDDLWVFARPDGSLPHQSTFSCAIKKFGMTFGVDITPQSLKLESVRRLMDLGVDDAAIQAHLGVTQSINYETRFKVLRTINTANKFVGKVIQKAKKKDDDGVD